MDVRSAQTDRGIRLIPSEGPATGHFLQPKWGDRPWGEGDLRDRLNVVLPLFKGESILDVGCASRYGRSDWLHGVIASSFPNVVGIDINEETIDRIKSEGFKAYMADAQDFDLHQTFDTVFAGEIIEHLDNVHGLLTSVRRHLGPGGRFVLDDTECLLHRWLRVPLGGTRSGSPRAHRLVLRGHTSTRSRSERLSAR